MQELDGTQKLFPSASFTPGLQDTLELITECSAKICRAEMVSLVLSSPLLDESVRTVARGRTGRGVIPQAVNSLIAGWVAKEQRAFHANHPMEIINIGTDNSNLDVVGPTLAIPLSVHKESLGTIVHMNYRGGRRFSETDLRNAMIVAPIATHIINRANMSELLSEENKGLKEELRGPRGLESILGASRTIMHIKDVLHKVAATSSTILLTGETGTGKGLAARAIHAQSPRASKPFIPLNCSAIPASLIESELFGHEKGAFTGATGTTKGKFELAHEGTIFLDEISSMPAELQPKLLRVLEMKKVARIGSAVELVVDVRIIATTNLNLEEAVAQGSFRTDLYHRLNVVPITMPPLRDRREDIPLLACAFIDELSGGTRGFSKSAQEFLAGLPWPGNVRELRNIVERACILFPSAEITAQQLRSLGLEPIPVDTSSLSSVLKQAVCANAPEKKLLDEIERVLVQLALSESGGNITESAKLLGMDRNALQRRMKKYNLSK